MEKKRLRALSQLAPTSEMIQLAEKDIPEKGHTQDKYRCEVYIRSQVMDGILKAAFFLARDLRIGGTRPVYEVFIDGKAGKFLTWDVVHGKWRTSMLMNLEWPRYITNSDTYIDPKENREMKQYLGVEADGYDGIFDYQERLRENALELRHKRITEPWDKVMAFVPSEPKDWKHWVDKHGIHQQYIFYDYVRNGAKTGYCTFCEKEVPIEKPKHNAEGTCKCCGRKIQFKARGRAGHFFTQEEWMYLVQKCRDGFVIRQYSAIRIYSKENYETPELSCKEERRYVYNAALEETPYYYGKYRLLEFRWIKGEKPDSGFGYYQYYRSREDMLGSVYKRTLPALASGVLSKTGFPQFARKVDRINPREYFQTLSQKPYLEQITKADLSRLAWSVIDDRRTLVLSKGNDFAKAIGIDKSRMKRLRECNGGFLYLEWLRFEKRRGINICNTVIEYFEQNNLGPGDLDFIIEKMNPVRICNYLKRQYRETGRSPKELVSTWRDYTDMAGRLKMDLEQEQIFKPKELMKGHDELVGLLGSKENALKAAEISKKYPDVDKICQQIREKYEYGDKDYRVIAPDRIEDIIIEGHILGHCLDRSDIYFDRIQTKESYILFLRKASEPDKPYYTLEVEPGGTTRQKRTVGDKQNADYEEAKKFIRKWQKAIRRRLTKEDWELAERSALLRVKELAELREKDVKIRHGHLAGKPLADVLEADLMEAELCAKSDYPKVEYAQEGEEKLCTAA
ncbi:PcfJ domain-containing protein [Enterocloster bolteae]|uniref:PcfJ domain-containing protein n=1 Tax=Enterocloster bolteae TaxID=208479 RepID=UPI0028DC6A45|nr:PcfJ domain-containing protein [Enterocloster bolteae]